MCVVGAFENFGASNDAESVRKLRHSKISAEIFPAYSVPENTMSTVTPSDGSTHGLLCTPLVLLLQVPLLL